MKRFIKKQFRNWLRGITRSFRRKPFRSTFNLIITPIFIYLIANILLGFGLLATIGYYCACLFGFSKILDDPLRVFKWAIGYAIATLVIPAIFIFLLPQLQQGTAMSLFASAFILYFIVMVWFKAREFQKA